MRDYQKTGKRSIIFLNRAVTQGTGFIPANKYKTNFLDYYATYVKDNLRPGNKQLSYSLAHFKEFIGKDHVQPIDIGENLCKRFRRHLLDRLNGEFPANYFAAFKRILKAATQDGYYRLSPAMM